MRDAPRLPEELRRVVAADIRPVRPLASPSRRLLYILLWITGALFFVLAVFGMRRDAPALGWLLMWGASLVEAGAGLGLTALALTAVVPGRTPSWRLAAALFLTSFLAFVVLAFLSRSASPGMTVPDPLLTFGPACFTLQTLIGLSGLLAAGILMTGAHPLRPFRASLLAGAGAGLMAEAAFRLHCGISDLRHVLVWHGAAILGLVAIAMTGGVLWERRQARLMAARLLRPHG